MAQYLALVQALGDTFQSFSATHIPINENSMVDALTNFVTFDRSIIKYSSLSPAWVTFVQLDEGQGWMTPIYAYLAKGTLPEDKREACKLIAS